MPCHPSLYQVGRYAVPIRLKPPVLGSYHLTLLGLCAACHLSSRAVVSGPRVAIEPGMTDPSKISPPMPGAPGLSAWADGAQARIRGALAGLPTPERERLAALRAEDRATSAPAAPVHPGYTGATVAPVGPLSGPVPPRKRGTWVSTPAPAPARKRGPGAAPSRPFGGFVGPGAERAQREATAPAPARSRRSRTRRGRPGRQERAAM